MTKTTAAAKNRYNKKAYDHIHYAPPTGFKDVIKGAAESKGMSVNAYITMAIENQIKEDQKGEANGK